MGGVSKIFSEEFNRQNWRSTVKTNFCLKKINVGIRKRFLSTYVWTIALFGWITCDKDEK